MIRASSAPGFARELDGALVPMVAVGDEQLSRVERRRSRRCARAACRRPRRPAVRLEHRRSTAPSASSRIGSGCTRVARRSRSRSSRMRACVRSCGSDRLRSRTAPPGATRSVRAARARRRPGRRSVSTASQSAGVFVALEDPAREPLAVEATRPPSADSGSVTWRTLYGLRVYSSRSLLVVDRVVRGRDEIRQRSGRAGVADGAERLDVGHRGERTNGLREIDSAAVTTIAELAEDRTVEGVFAVTKKERRRTRAGAAYLALELADASGRVEARVWNDVDLLDQRFGEGDAVHVLGRVERFGGQAAGAGAGSGARGGRRPGRAHAHAASRRRRARRLLRVPRSRDHPRRAWPSVVGSFVRDTEIRAGAPVASGGRSRRAPRLRRRPTRAHRRRHDALPRDRAAASPAPSRPPARPPRSCTTSGASASSVVARRSGRPRRAGSSATCTSACG